MHVLQVDTLTKSYAHSSGRVQVLRGLDCTVTKGETAAILGPSGSGKSTLLAMLAGLDKPDSGGVSLMGKDLTTMSEEKLTTFRSQHMGIVFQQFHLMGHLNALENVSLPLDILSDPQAEERAKTALQDVGLGHRLHHFPHELSGGECQRVAIARAFVAAPDLILADEPSGNLDFKTGDHVMSMLFDLVKAKSTTMILVTHNEDLAARCDRRFRLADGLLQEQASV